METLHSVVHSLVIASSDSATSILHQQEPPSSYPLLVHQQVCRQIPAECTGSMVKPARPGSFPLQPLITLLGGSRRRCARIGIVLTNLQTMLNDFLRSGLGILRDMIDIPGATAGRISAFGTPAIGPFANKPVALSSQHQYPAAPFLLGAVCREGIRGSRSSAMQPRTYWLLVKSRRRLRS